MSQTRTRQEIATGRRVNLRHSRCDDDAAILLLGGAAVWLALALALALVADNVSGRSAGLDLLFGPDLVAWSQFTA